MPLTKQKKLKIKTNKNKSGFTLIEILVSVAVISILLTISSAIFINTLRNANQAAIVNEARENSALVADTFERDIRSALSVKCSDHSGNTNNSTTCTLDATDTPASYNLLVTTSTQSILWKCVQETGSTNGFIARGYSSGASYTVYPLTNESKTDGVSVDTNSTSCVFSLTGSPNTVVQFSYEFTEGANVHLAAQEYQVKLPYSVSVSTRNF